MLEDVVRPKSLSLAREAVQRGIQVEEMCLKPTWNQRCYSCGLHHGWACVCTSEMKRKAYNEHVDRVNAPNYKDCTTRLFPNAGKSDRKPGQPEKSDTIEKPDKESGRLCQCGCGASLGHLSPQARFHSDACRKRAYRGRK